MSLKQTIRNSTTFSICLAFYKRYFYNRRGKFGYIHPTAFVRLPALIKGRENVFLYENTHLLAQAKILAVRAKFIMKKNAVAAEGLTVVTGNHYSKVGMWLRDIPNEMKPKDLDKDVVVDEDVWIATNVTLLSGVHVGRGAVIGSGSVCRNNIPPYAMVMGNPAKVVGFKFTPEEIIEHEKVLYPEEERLSLEKLEKNYKKYFIDRIKEIKNFLKN